MKYPIEVETRFSIAGGVDRNGQVVKPETFFPMGVMHLIKGEWDRGELNNGYGPDRFWTMPWTIGRPEGYWAIFQADGSPMYKYVFPSAPSLEYTEVKFIYYGIWYVLEIRRLDFDNEDSQKENV